MAAAAAADAAAAAKAADEAEALEEAELLAATDALRKAEAELEAAEAARRTALGGASTAAVDSTARAPAEAPADEQGAPTPAPRVAAAGPAGASPTKERSVLSRWFGRGGSRSRSPSPPEPRGESEDPGYRGDAERWVTRALCGGLRYFFILLFGLQWTTAFLIIFRWCRCGTLRSSPHLKRAPSLRPRLLLLN